MIPRPFEYHAPSALPDVIALLDKYGDDAKLLAGGHSLLPMMKLRFAGPAHLIDLRKISALKGIALEGYEMRIGAMTTENELIFSPLLAEHLPLLRRPHARSPTRRCATRGTIGGDISHGDPATTTRP